VQSNVDDPIQNARMNVSRFLSISDDSSSISHFQLSAFVVYHINHVRTKTQEMRYYPTSPPRSLDSFRDVLTKPIDFFRKLAHSLIMILLRPLMKSPQRPGRMYVWSQNLTGCQPSRKSGLNEFIAAPTLLRISSRLSGRGDNSPGIARYIVHSPSAFQFLSLNGGPGSSIRATNRRTIFPSSGSGTKNG
jgi:hypothetical protein